MKRLQKHVKNNWFWYSLLIVILSSFFAPMLLIVPLFIGIVILFAKKSTSQSSNDSEVSIGKRGGRYEMRISEKTGKPYRHYF